MSFVRKLVGPDEKLVGIARLHWIYGIKGLCWLAGFLLLGGAINWVFLDFAGGALGSTAVGGLLVLGNAAFWVCLIIGVSLFIFYFIMLLATEIGLTTRRLIYKKGLIFVDVKETDLEEIKGASVDNEILGRIFNYGTLHLDARFIADLELPSIADPYRFVKALNDLRSQMKDAGISLSIDGNAPKAKSKIEHALKHDQPRMGEHLDRQTADEETQGDTEPNPVSINAERYHAFDDVEPLHMLNDIADDTNETVETIKKQPVPKVFAPKKDNDAPQQGESKDKGAPPENDAQKPQSHPILISELKEEVQDDFTASSTRH